jgi:tetratricopeptide (TPR) repeat protein
MIRSSRLVLIAALGMTAGLTGCQSNVSNADAFDMGLDRAPTPRTLHMMARLLEENGRVDQAQYVLMTVIDKNPQYLPAYVELADMQVDQKQFDRAVETLTRAHEVAPTDPVIANNLGVLLLRRSDFVVATEAFRSAVEADPEEARYRANLALSLGMQGLDEDAFRVYCAVLPPAEAYWNLGVIAEARSDNDAANGYFAKADRIRDGIDWDDSVGFEPAVTASVPVN